MLEDDVIFQTAVHWQDLILFAKKPIRHLQGIFLWYRALK